MIRRLAPSLMTLACGAVALTGASPAAAAPSTLPALPAASCSGTVTTTATSTGATTTGSATCTGATALKLSTTLHAAGGTSTVTSLLPALPNLPVPINTTVPAVGLTTACSVLVNTATGATVASSCDAA